MESGSVVFKVSSSMGRLGVAAVPEDLAQTALISMPMLCGQCSPKDACCRLCCGHFVVLADSS